MYFGCAVLDAMESRRLNRGILRDAAPPHEAVPVTLGGVRVAGSHGEQLFRLAAFLGAKVIRAFLNDTRGWFYIGAFVGVALRTM